MSTAGTQVPSPHAKCLAAAASHSSYADGPNLVTLAMNDWADTEPAWWLNLQVQPDTTVDLAGGSRPVRARAVADLAAARKSVERLRKMDAGTVYPGHGEAFDFARLNFRA